MHFGELTEVEQRVLGCLIEKRWTTPDQYPLSLNALRLACNQSTNRDPVVSYDEPAAAPAPAAHDDGALEVRVAALEAEVANLKAQLADLLE